MLQDEILFRLLQFSTCAGSIALFITCMRMHNAKWWLSYPLYVLAFSLAITFMTSFYIRRYTFDLAVINLFMLAVSSIATMTNSFLNPLPVGNREAINRRVIYTVIPLLFVFVFVWCTGTAFEGGIGYFQKLDVMISKVLGNQRDMINHQVEIDEALATKDSADVLRDSVVRAYRIKLDRRLDELQSEIDAINDPDVARQRKNLKRQQRWQRP